MITIAYQSIQYLDIEIEGLTEGDIEEMTDEEVMKLVEDTYTFSERDDFSCSENIMEKYEVLNEDDKSIRYIERRN